jgi:hypothetical protein
MIGGKIILFFCLNVILTFSTSFTNRLTLNSQDFIGSYNCSYSIGRHTSIKINLAVKDNFKYSIIEESYTAWPKKKYSKSKDRGIWHSKGDTLFLCSKYCIPEENISSKTKPDEKLFETDTLILKGIELTRINSKQILVKS